MRADFSDKKRKQKSKYGIALVLILILAIALYFVITTLSAGKDEDKNSMKIKTFLETTLSEVQNVNKAAKAGEFMKDGRPQYNLLFGNSVVIGDSITEGLTAYGFLTEEQCVCQIGGSVMKCNDAIASAARLSPVKAFFSFGSNDMGMYSGNSKGFIERYSEVIKNFMEMSPDTEVYVNSIPKPSDDKISSGGYFYKWEDFNSEIKAMCEEMDIKYIDNTHILTDHPEFYAGDGIHVVPAYYPYWIENMVKGSM